MEQNGVVIDVLIQPRRDRWTTALRFFRKLLHTAESLPRVIITDKLRSYAAAKKLILPTSSIGKVDISTTELRIRINQPA